MPVRKLYNCSRLWASSRNNPLMRLPCAGEWNQEMSCDGRREQDTRLEPNSHMGFMVNDDATVLQSQTSTVQGLGRTGNKTLQVHSRNASECDSVDRRTTFKRFTVRPKGQRTGIYMRPVRRMQIEWMESQYPVVNPCCSESEQKKHRKNKLQWTDANPSRNCHSHGKRLFLGLQPCRLKESSGIHVP